MGLVVAVLVVAWLVALAVVALVVAGLVVGLRAGRLLTNFGGGVFDLVCRLLLIVFALLTLIIGAGRGRLRRRARRGRRHRVAGERSGDSGAREQRQGGHGDDQLPWVHPGRPFVPGARLPPRHLFSAKGEEDSTPDWGWQPGDRSNSLGDWNRVRSYRRPSPSVCHPRGDPPRTEGSLQRAASGWSAHHDPHRRPRLTSKPIRVPRVSLAPGLRLCRSLLGSRDGKRVTTGSTRLDG